MAGMCISTKQSDSAWLECVVVKNIRSSMAGMCRDKKRKIPNVRNVLCLKTQGLAWLEYVVVQYVIFNTCYGQKHQIQHVLNVSW
jgi:hypothetical protein